ncbi:DUF4244 domain-containing protein [Streptomyces sp. NPDC001941]|uniref:DUF4244 domain-containing protein n=1 Tax=Streptomyces sp. NPDC001941 TaxID=3154659 RepID=UPI003330F28E
MRKVFGKAKAGVAAVVRARRLARRSDRGMATAEYALATVAACGFAGLLYKLVTSDTMSGALQSLIGKALGAEF